MARRAQWPTTDTPKPVASARSISLAPLRRGADQRQLPDAGGVDLAHHPVDRAIIERLIGAQEQAGTAFLARGGDALTEQVAEPGGLDLDIVQVDLALPVQGKRDRRTALLERRRLALRHVDL